tara:strand:+ start:5352 stop:5717 length:366 start_codon:yes stop_codon:yes gene_type:complete
MKFKEFLNELAMPVTSPNLDLAVAGAVNHDLDMELDDIILSPEIGFYKMRKVLHRYGFDLPALYDIEEEGDESVFDLHDGSLLYVLYYLTDDGNYDFYAKLTDEAGVEEMLSKDEGLEEED